MHTISHTIPNTPSYTIPNTIPQYTVTLRPMAYEMALSSFLPDPQDHVKLLTALQAWPRRLYDAQHLIDMLLQRYVCGYISVCVGDCGCSLSYVPLHTHSYAPSCTQQPKKNTQTPPKHPPNTQYSCPWR